MVDYATIISSVIARWTQVKWNTIGKKSRNVRSNCINSIYTSRWILSGCDMLSRPLVESRKQELKRRKKKRLHKDDCASARRCNIPSALGNADSTKQIQLTHERKSAPACVYLRAHLPALLLQSSYYSHFLYGVLSHLSRTILLHPPFLPRKIDHILTRS